MNNQFHYTYTALTEEERSEILSIRHQYHPVEQTESKLERLRRLNDSVKSMPTVFALILGIGGSLIFGLGLAMILEWNILLWGIVLCILGAVPMLFSYPVYRISFQKRKEKFSAEILQLTEELLSEKN